jgi:hypothetical protein
MSIFGNTGLGYININIHSLKPVLKEHLHDHFIQQWFTDIENSSRGEFRVFESIPRFVLGRFLRSS